MPERVGAGNRPAAWAIARLAPKGHFALHDRPGDRSGMPMRPSGVVFERMEVSRCLLIAPIPLVEGLAADPIVTADLGHRATALVHLDPRQPLLNVVPAASLQRVTPLLKMSSFTRVHLIGECHPCFMTQHSLINLRLHEFDCEAIMRDARLKTFAAKSGERRWADGPSTTAADRPS